MEKLKINEVRIGNWVDQRSRQQNKLMNFMVPKQIELYDLQFIALVKKYDYLGIILTEDIIKNIEGFEENNFDSGWQYAYGWYNEKHALWFVENKRAEEPTWSLCRVESCPNCECNIENMIYIKGGIKYVHELQNIWHCLTGEELEIKFLK